MAHRIPELKLQIHGILLIASLSPGGSWALVKSPLVEVPWDHEGRQYLNIFLKTNITSLSNNKLGLMAARVSSPLELPPGVEVVGFVPGQEKEPGTARRRPIVFVLKVEYLAR